MIKLVIFDFDGVIVTGTNQGYFYCYHQALINVGVKLSPQEEKKRVEERWGKGYKSQLELLLKENLELLPRAVASYEKCYESDRFQKNIRLIKGAKEELETLSKYYTLAIASGMIKKTMNILINKFKIKNYFKNIITIDDVEKEEYRKPSPYMINSIKGTFSISSNETVYVGDAKSDVIMAQNAKVTSIVVLTGNLNRKEAEKLGVKYIVKDITYLNDLLIKL